MKKEIYKYFGALFFGALYIINLIIKVSPDINNFLIFMTVICLLIPVIQKQNVLKK
jgi:hypothetical protein